ASSITAAAIIGCRPAARFTARPATAATPAPMSIASRTRPQAPPPECSARLVDALANPLAGLPAPPFRKAGGLLQHLLAALDVAALDAELAQALESARQLGVVADLPVDLDALREVILGAHRLFAATGVVEQRGGVALAQRHKRPAFEVAQLGFL